MRYLISGTIVYFLSFTIIMQNPCYASSREDQIVDCKPERIIQSLTVPIPPLKSIVHETEQWLKLPEKLWVYIFDNLSFRYLKRISPVCKLWFRLTHDE